jgi:hypothetical protein
MTVFPKAMWVALAPYLVVAFAVALVAGAAYEAGAPAWTVYPAAILAGLIVLPAYLRWDKQHFGD